MRGATTIHVAVGRIHLDLPGCHNLKQKRKIIRPLVKRLRDRFGVSAAEVGYHDVWQSALVAVAAIGGEASELDGLLQEAMRFVRRSVDGVVVDFGIEVIAVGELLPTRGPGKETPRADASSIEETWLGEEER